MRDSTSPKPSEHISRHIFTGKRVEVARVGNRKKSEFFEQEIESKVPHWMSGWLLVTFLNTLGIVDVEGFRDTCALIMKIPFLADTLEFQKYQMNHELEPDEFIRLFRVVKSEAQTRQDVNT